MTLHGSIIAAHTPPPERPLGLLVLEMFAAPRFYGGEFEARRVIRPGERQSLAGLTTLSVVGFVNREENARTPREISGRAGGAGGRWSKSGSPGSRMERNNFIRASFFHCSSAPLLPCSSHHGCGS